MPYLPTGTETDWTEHQIDWTAISAMDECKSSYWEDDGNVEVSPQRRAPAMPTATSSGPLEKTAQQIMADKRKEAEEKGVKAKPCGTVTGSADGKDNWHGEGNVPRAIPL